MIESWLDVYDEIAGVTLRIKCRDDLFNYVNYRNILPEKICIALINEIKKKFNKKAVVIFGNCQTRQLLTFLISNPTFYKNYFFIQIPEVCRYNEKSLPYSQESFWAVTDLFISQRVGKGNRFSPLLATDNLSSKLSENAKIVWIPNVYFDGYFPQHKQDSNYLQNARDIGKPLPPSGNRMNGDKYVDKFLTKIIGGGGITISEFTEYIKKQDFISEKEVLEGVEKSFEELRKREKICDIHMSDVVVENYTKKQIFYSPNHPSQEILWEETKRILKFIGIDDMTFDNFEKLLDEKSSLIGVDIPIYPKVKKILGLKNSLTKYYSNKGVSNFRGDYIEFLTEYVRRCWKDKIILK